MKEYKYTINGNKYEVVIGDIVENIAPTTITIKPIVKYNNGGLKNSPIPLTVISVTSLLKR